MYAFRGDYRSLPPLTGYPTLHSFRPSTDTKAVKSTSVMNMLSTDTLAVPDSAFPYGMTSELAGLLDGPASPEEDALEGLKLSSLRGDGSYTPDYYTQLPYAPGVCVGV